MHKHRGKPIGITRIKLYDEFGFVRYDTKLKAVCEQCGAPFARKYRNIRLSGGDIIGSTIKTRWWHF